MKKWMLSGLMCAFCALWWGVAMADVVPPEVTACEGKSAGDSCTTSDQKAGKCEASKCSRTLPPSDGGQPQTQEYDCTKCVSGSTNDPAPPSENATQEPTGGKDGGTQDNATTQDTAPPKSGCDIAGGARFGMGFVLLFLGFLAAWRLTRTPQETR